MNKHALDFWVGLFVALGLAALLGLSLKVGNLTASRLGETYHLVAYFENIGSLKPRAPVKSAGVVIGRVDGIGFDTKQYRAVVHLRIDKRYQFPKDSFATIFTSGLLGEQYINLGAGGEVENLKDNDTIDHTEDAVVLEKLISLLLFNKASEGKAEQAEASAAK